MRVNQCAIYVLRCRRMLPWIRHHAGILTLILVVFVLLTLQLSINLTASRGYTNHMIASVTSNQSVRMYKLTRVTMTGPVGHKLVRRSSHIRDSQAHVDQHGVSKPWGTLFRWFGVGQTISPTPPPACPFPPGGLVGKLSVTYQSLPWRELERLHPDVMSGGTWLPSNCTSRYRVAIIVPFRDRSHHLRLFLDHIHPFLQRQMIAYGIYVVEQDPYSPFNRGLLLNIGYREAMADASYDCAIFHDVDLLPENDFNLYSCPDQPRHMSVAVDEFAYRLPYDSLFGGVEAFKKEHFELINGFSNMYFGWGAEDDDLYNRLRHYHLNLTRYDAKIARYSMVRHLKNNPNPVRLKFLDGSRDRFDIDGLSSLIYDRKRLERRKLFTWIYARVNQTAILDQLTQREKSRKYPNTLHSLVV